MPCARASKSIGMPVTSSCVKAARTWTASANRSACAASARAADANPQSAASPAKDIHRATNDDLESVRIELLHAEVAAMVTGKAGQTDK